MRQKDYTDERGRRYRVKLPDNVPDEEAHKGVPVGPPDVVDVLGLPEPLATRMHNALFDQQLWNINSVRKKQRALLGILQRVLRIDVHKIMDAYRELERS